MSKLDIVYMILFIALCPGLWLLASLLDRMWPSNLERQKRSRGS
jgi:hypothetical protein